MHNWRALAAFVLGSATGILVAHLVPDFWLVRLSVACLTAGATTTGVALLLHTNWSQVFCLHRERDQGNVGFCKRCHQFKRTAHTSAGWERYVMPPTGPPPQGMPPRAPRPFARPADRSV